MKFLCSVLSNPKVVKNGCVTNLVCFGELQFWLETNKGYFKGTETVEESFKGVHSRQITTLMPNLANLIIL